MFDDPSHSFGHSKRIHKFHLNPEFNIGKMYLRLSPLFLPTVRSSSYFVGWFIFRVIYVLLLWKCCPFNDRFCVCWNVFDALLLIAKNDNKKSALCIYSILEWKKWHVHCAYISSMYNRRCTLLNRYLILTAYPSYRQPTDNNDSSINKSTNSKYKKFLLPLFVSLSHTHTHMQTIQHRQTSKKTYGKIFCCGGRWKMHDLKMLRM